MMSRISLARGFKPPTPYTSLFLRTYAAPSMPRPDPPINNGPLFRNGPFSQTFNHSPRPSSQHLPNRPPPPPQPQPQATSTHHHQQQQSAKQDKQQQQQQQENSIPQPIWHTAPLPNPPEPTLISLVLDRQALHPSPAETAQFGTDDQVAQHPSSFDPSITAPEREFFVLDEECRVGGEADPLLVSPANREVSRLLSPAELDRAVQGGVKIGPSARGWTNKHGAVRVRAVSVPDVPAGGEEVGKMGKGKRGRGMSVGGRALGVDRYERLLRGLREVQRRGRSGREGTA
ncbi:hypothetical protein BDW42DRAFT_176423 [Aspergillus taichungensis]|uniref:Uncharacterized protein n=1 Tax=Aspergillus taichungensis TaxID=482145 RepID=A0A2J5HKU4_9EURO|nr:hypothetical protein BDW42DRAFT_176423 [Aspergillus taichungensis]